jgi:hypothetical protein
MPWFSKKRGNVIQGGHIAIEEKAHQNKKIAVMFAKNF